MDRERPSSTPTAVWIIAGIVGLFLALGCCLVPIGALFFLRASAASAPTGPPPPPAAPPIQAAPQVEPPELQPAPDPGAPSSVESEAKPEPVSE